MSEPPPRATKRQHTIAPAIYDRKHDAPPISSRQASPSQRRDRLETCELPTETIKCERILVEHGRSLNSCSENWLRHAIVLKSKRSARVIDAHRRTRWPARIRYFFSSLVSLHWSSTARCSTCLADPRGRRSGRGCSRSGSFLRSVGIPDRPYSHHVSLFASILSNFLPSSAPSDCSLILWMGFADGIGMARGQEIGEFWNF
jgi:hypothetical protein